jgi:hypothetical protein
VRPFNGDWYTQPKKESETWIEQVRDQRHTCGVTLSFVFGASGIVLFGWEAGVLIALAAPAIVQLLEHRPLERVAFNASVFAVGAGAAALLVSFVDGSGTAAIVSEVAISATTQYALNLILVSAAVAVTARRPFAELVVSSARATSTKRCTSSAAGRATAYVGSGGWWRTSSTKSAAISGSN